MSVEAAKQQFNNLRSTIGREALSSMFPSDFEVYLTVFELVDSAGKVVDYFLFPINPQSISVSEYQIVNIKKTAGGISTISTDTYMPKVISINGDFGRKFKILFGKTSIDFVGFSFSEQLKKNFNEGIFSNTVKTGYGCIKILERLIKKSNQLDRYGLPYFLYFYNLSFGESYVVKCIGQPTFDSNVEKNMIWSYNFQLQTVADLNQIQNDSKLSNLTQLGFSLIQKGLNNIASDVLSII